QDLLFRQIHVAMIGNNCVFGKRCCCIVNNCPGDSHCKSFNSGSTSLLASPDSMEWPVPRSVEIQVVTSDSRSCSGGGVEVFVVSACSSNGGLVVFHAATLRPGGERAPAHQRNFWSLVRQRLIRSAFASTRPITLSIKFVV